MKRIDCSVVRDILPLYLDGVVSAETREIVKEHLAECPDCRAKAWALKEDLRLPILAEQQKQEAKALRQRRWKNIPWKRVVPIFVLVLITVLCLLCLPSKLERCFYKFQAEERYYYDGNTIVYIGPDLPGEQTRTSVWELTREEQDRIFAALEELTYEGKGENHGFSASDDEMYELRMVGEWGWIDICVMESGLNHYLWYGPEDAKIQVGNYQPLLQVLEEIFWANVDVSAE